MVKSDTNVSSVYLANAVFESSDLLQDISSLDGLIFVHGACPRAGPHGACAKANKDIFVCSKLLNKCAR